MTQIPSAADGCERPDPDRREPSLDGQVESDSSAHEAARQFQRRSLAAWEVGRRLNHLRFRLQQAWLLPTTEQAVLARAMWDDLALSVRGLGATVQETDRLRNQVVKTNRTWEVEFSSLWHLEALLAADAEIAQRLQQHNEIESNSSIHADVCESLLQSVWTLCDELQQTIENVLPEPIVEILRLAERVDEGLHPREIFRHMLVPSIEAPSEAGTFGPADEGVNQGPSERVSEAGTLNPWIIPARENNELHDHAIVSSALGGGRAASRIARYSHEVAPVPPDSLWLQEIEQRWGEVGFPQGQIPPGIGERNVGQPQALENLVCELYCP